MGSIAVADAVAMLAGGQENVERTARSTETEEESSGYGTGYRVESLSVSTQSVAESSGRSSSDDAVPCRLGQFGADPVHRFAYQKSPSGSLWVGDCIAGVSIFVANDFRTCALTFPFGRILLTCSTRIHVAVKTNTDRKRQDAIRRGSTVRQQKKIGQKRFLNSIRSKSRCVSSPIN